jgi:hypothetical protein
MSAQWLSYCSRKGKAWLADDNSADAGIELGGVEFAPLKN